MPEFEFSVGGTEVWVPKVLVDANLASSTSEGKRLLGQGAVRMDEEVVKLEKFTPEKGRAYVVKCGKRKFARIRFN
jgi:tyrosyl-tRNA synthetase